MNLSDILGPDAVRAPLRATGKKARFQRLAELAASVYGLEAEAVYQALLRREKLGSTGVDAAWRSRKHGFQSWIMSTAYSCASRSRSPSGRPIAGRSISSSRSWARTPPPRT